LLAAHASHLTALDTSLAALDVRVAALESGTTGPETGAWFVNGTKTLMVDGWGTTDTSEKSRTYECLNSTTASGQSTADQAEPPSARPVKLGADQTYVSSYTAFRANSVGLSLYRAGRYALRFTAEVCRIFHAGDPLAGGAFFPASGLHIFCAIVRTAHDTLPSWNGPVEASYPLPATTAMEVGVNASTGLVVWKPGEYVTCPEITAVDSTSMPGEGAVYPAWFTSDEVVCKRAAGAFDAVTVEAVVEITQADHVRDGKHWFWTVIPYVAVPQRVCPDGTLVPTALSSISGSLSNWMIDLHCEYVMTKTGATSQHFDDVELQAL